MKDPAKASETLRSEATWECEMLLRHSDIKGFAIFWVQGTCHLNAGEIHVRHFFSHIGPFSLLPEGYQHNHHHILVDCQKACINFFNLPPPYNHGLKVTYLCSLPSRTTLLPVRESQHAHQIQP